MNYIGVFRTQKEITKTISLESGHKYLNIKIRNTPQIMELSQRLLKWE